MNFLKWLFGKKDKVGETTKEFEEWKKRILQDKKAMEKMGNRLPKKFYTREALLARYTKTFNKSPYKNT